MFDYGPFSLNSLCINLQISLVLKNVTPPKQTLLRGLEATISTRGFLEVVQHQRVRIPDDLHEKFKR